MSDTDSQSMARPARWPALMLAAAAAVLIAAGLLGGLLGFSTSEQFSLDDARKIRGEMYLHRIDVTDWPEPPFLVIDDSRFGPSGSSTRLFLDGEEVTERRVSPSILQKNEAPGFIHAGVYNLYLATGPRDTPPRTIEVVYMVQLDSAVWMALVAAGALLLIAAAGFLMARAVIFDTSLIVLAAATAAGGWLTLSGVQVTYDLNAFEARQLKPHGYIVRLPAPWPLVHEGTDRITMDVAGRLFVDGEPVPNAMALSGEIAEDGDGAHLMTGGGVFYYSVPGNRDPAAVNLDLRARANLHWTIWAIAGGALALVLVSGLAGGVTPVLRVLVLRRPATAALTLPIAIGAVVAGYVGWLVWVDPLHMRTSPGDRDWFADEEAWRMAGLVRTYPYRGIILGTSVSQNFYMAEASAVLGMPILNATMAGSTPREQAALARLALQRPTTQLVLWEMHVSSFQLPADETRTGYFPQHLYDDNPLTDLEYYFSLQAWLDATAKQTAHRVDQTVRLDPINKWGERLDFGPSVIAETYCERLDRQPPPIDEEALRRNLRANVVPAATSRPDVRFVLFIPAYSVFMHLEQGGRSDEIERAARIILEETSGLPNVEVFDFLGIGEIIGDPNIYRDDMHYHPKINSQILRHIAQSRFKVDLATIDGHEEELRRLFSRTAPAFTRVMNPVCRRADG